MRWLFLFFALTIVIKLSGQDSFDDRSRANYIYFVAENVEWPDDKQADSFRIAILEDDSSLVKILREKRQNKPELHQLPIRIHWFKRIEDIRDIHVLYLHKNSGYNIFEVSDKTWGYHTLIISENYPYHQSMLNFIYADGKREFEINKRKFNAAELSADALFLAHAIQNKADWQALYEKTEHALLAEKKIVEEQESTIKNQKQEIENQTQLITKQNQKLNHLKDEIKTQESILYDRQKEVKRQEQALLEQKGRMKVQEDSMKFQKSILKQQKEAITQQKDLIRNQQSLLSQQLKSIEKQKLTIYFFGILVLLLIAMGYFIYRAYKIKRKANQVLEQKNKHIEAQRDEIAEQNQKITDSINYAKRIQNAILPDTKNFQSVLEHFFILYKPKDIVSGDFYWQTHYNDKLIIVAADCTGHGVPGAFMSMLGVTFLNDIVNRQGITQPNEILNELRSNIIHSLHQEEKKGQVRDGMDIAICCIDNHSGIVQFAGANNPMILIRDQEINVLKGDKMPVAIYEKMLSFTHQEVKLKKNDTIYIFSDGYADQFGGEKGRKFMIKRLKETLLSVHKILPMQEQKHILNKKFEEWKGDENQIDDVLLIGIKIT